MVVPDLSLYYHALVRIDPHLQHLCFELEIAHQLEAFEGFADPVDTPKNNALFAAAIVVLAQLPAVVALVVQQTNFVDRPCRISQVDGR